MSNSAKMCYKEYNTFHTNDLDLEIGVSSDRRLIGHTKLRQNNTGF